MQDAKATAAKVLSIARAHQALGISGPRKFSPGSRHEAVIRWLIESCPEQYIITGCANGADAAARATRHGATVYYAKDYQAQGVPYVAALAKRSMACVENVKAEGGIWCAFPNSPCPSKIRPHPRWISGTGSGTWASLGYAAGLGVPCLVWSEAEVMPEWLRKIGRGWWAFEGVDKTAPNNELVDK
jgi:hypothetical protein